MYFYLNIELAVGISVLKSRRASKIGYTLAYRTAARALVSRRHQK